MPTWAALIPIIVQYGLPTAEKLFQKWSSGTPPTQADFDELRGLAKQSAGDVLKARLVAAGIALDSPQATQLLALIQ
jgi:hypothetical protein